MISVRWKYQAENIYADVISEETGQMRLEG